MGRGAKGLISTARGAAITGIAAALLLLSGCSTVAGVFDRDTAAYKAFQGFASDYLKYQNATPSHGANEAVKEEIQQRIENNREWVNLIHGIAYELVTEEAAEDGSSVQIEAHQKSSIDPIGVFSGTGTWACKTTFKVTMVKSGDEWKVGAFDDGEFSMRSCKEFR